MGLLVEYRVLDNLKVINEGSGATKKVKVRGKFQKCDEQNNNGRSYPRKILESQVKEIQGKIQERSLVGALDHPPNDAIHLSQASHLITKLWVESNGDVMGEAEILSTPNGQIVQALLDDKVKIGISSRGLGTISENKNGRVVNDDFKLITFDLVSDPSTKGAFPELTESVRLNSQKAQKIVSKMKSEKILLTLLEQKIDEKIEEGLTKKINKAKKNDFEVKSGKSNKDYKLSPGPKDKKFADVKAKTLARTGEADYNTFGFDGLLGKKDAARRMAHKKSRGVKTKGQFSENKIYQKLIDILNEKKSKGLEFVSGSKKSKMFGNFNDKRLKTEPRVNVKESKPVESLGRLLEGSATSKDKDAIKLYLLSHLQDLQWSYPYDEKSPSYPATKTPTDKIDLLKKLLQIIEEI